MAANTREIWFRGYHGAASFALWDAVPGNRLAGHPSYALLLRLCAGSCAESYVRAVHRASVRAVPRMQAGGPIIESGLC